MALRDLLKAPLDTTDPNVDAFLRSVQGNIIKGHGRHHAAQVFITFGPDIKAARRWIAGIMLHRLTLAGPQVAQTRAWKAVRGDGEAFFAFFLSRDGYRTLGVADAQAPPDPYFQAGMKSTPTGVNTTISDPPVSQWEANFQQRIDAMALVAHADAGKIDPLAKMLADELTALGARVFVERGDQQLFDFPPRKNVEIEHFGHQDGISQPRMVKQEAEQEIAERGGANWNPVAPLQLGFIEEPGGSDTFGSYLVFRKLQQNVRAFRNARDGLAAALQVDVETAAALAVGRFRDGRPIIPTKVVKPGADPNDFSFNQDPNAAVCPYQAHIRKTNPRGDIVRILHQTEEFERSKRILRRGITYGARPDLQPGSTLPAPEAGVGLLFMSYQADLNQFAIQQDGADSNDFVNQGTGPDAVLGVNAAATAQQWPVNGVSAAKPFLMSNFITMLGGEYFFAPSPAFLASL
jgi:deferrochelatase/peroxidase EfeB